MSKKVNAAGNAPGNKGWLQQNVKNMPLTSVALAGVLGAGLVALCNYNAGKRSKSDM